MHGPPRTMTATNTFAAKTIAAVRIATGVIFLFFGEYKNAGSQWAHGGFESWIHGFINAGTPVDFYKPFLVHVVLGHPMIFAWMVGVGEFAIGLSLVSGAFVRAASVGGGFYMINLALTTWFSPGHGVPVWRYLGANLNHVPLLFLFAIFFAARAGETWGLDGMVLSRSRRAPAQDSTSTV
jgi:uncharacterized membrane protein YphA (DoxX/SURF4 family)